MGAAAVPQRQPCSFQIFVAELGQDVEMDVVRGEDLGVQL
jgi:hypothetical protein